MTVSKLFEDAADFIEEHGWVQHSMRSAQGVCVMGALAAVRGAFDREVYGQAIDLIYERTSSGPRSWNDKPSRTKEDVTGLLLDLAVEHSVERELVPA